MCLHNSWPSRFQLIGHRSPDRPEYSIPVFNLEMVNTAKFFRVVGNERCPICCRCAGDEDVVGTDREAFRFQLCSNAGRGAGLLDTEC